MLLTRPPLTEQEQALIRSARLACIRHAASVRPEPGSNSPKKCLIAQNTFGIFRKIREVFQEAKILLNSLLLELNVDACIVFSFQRTFNVELCRLLYTNIMFSLLSTSIF